MIWSVFLWPAQLSTQLYYSVQSRSVPWLVFVLSPQPLLHFQTPVTGVQAVQLLLAQCNFYAEMATVLSRLYMGSAVDPSGWSGQQAASEAGSGPSQWALVCTANTESRSSSEHQGLCSRYEMFRTRRACASVWRLCSVCGCSEAVTIGPCSGPEESSPHPISSRSPSWYCLPTSHMVSSVLISCKIVVCLSLLPKNAPHFVIVSILLLFCLSFVRVISWNTISISSVYVTSVRGVKDQRLVEWCAKPWWQMYVQKLHVNVNVDRSL
jgi:hypothetical protein